jgi:hypothetical protein
MYAVFMKATFCGAMEAARSLYLVCNSIKTSKGRLHLGNKIRGPSKNIPITCYTEIILCIGSGKYGDSANS